MEICKILIAIDFSENPEELADRVASRFNCQNAVVYPVHIIQDMSRLSFYSDAYQLWEEYRDRAVKDTIERMNAYVKALSVKFREVQPVIEVGEPDEKIVETAERLGTDIIIMGNHARQGIQHLLHRNVAERVMRLTKREVYSYYVEM